VSDEVLLEYIKLKINR